MFTALRTLEEQQPWIRMVRWALVAFFFCVDEASIVALVPSIGVLQMEVYAKTTDCLAMDDCATYVVKRGALSGSIVNFVKLLLAAPYGVAADRFGRRPMYLIAAIAPLLTLPFLLGSPSSLVPYYVMSTIAGFLPSGAQLITLMIVDLTEAGDRFRVMSLFALGNMALALVANLIGAAVVVRIGTQGILQVSLVVTLIEVLVLFLFLPETSINIQNEQSSESNEETESPSPSQEKKKAALKRQTSANIGDVLFKSNKIDADHAWEAKAFWLYLLAELPDSIGASQLQFLIITLFGYTVDEYGRLTSILMFYQFFWLSLGQKIFKQVLPNEARIFQAVMGFTFGSDVLFYFWFSFWAPYVSMFPATANVLISLTLRALILDVTADHRQGKVLGFLTATDRLCNIIGPSIGAFFFTIGVEYLGTPRWIFLSFFCTLKPLAIAAASYTLTKQAMPAALRARIETSNMKGVAEDSFWKGI